MNFLDNEIVMFNTLLNSEIHDIYRICKTSKIADEICKDKYFWVKKFEHNNIPIFEQQDTLEDWIDEYVAVKDAIIDAGDIIKISLIEKERDTRIDILFPNDGTIMVIFLDEFKYKYDLWVLPKELTSLVVDELDQEDYKVYPVQFKFVPNGNQYKLIYNLVCIENENQDIEVSIDGLTIKEVEDILIKSIYFHDLEITDSMGTNYLFYDNRDLFPVNRTNSKYYNMVKNSRLGMRDMLEYQRKY
jgi:hypothetical protein